MENNVIYGINGPVVTVKDADCFEMMEMVHVGEQNLVGEVIGITSDFTTIQVYEETTGLTGRCCYRYRRTYECTSRTGNY